MTFWISWLLSLNLGVPHAHAWNVCQAKSLMRDYAEDFKKFSFEDLGRIEPPNECKDDKTFIQGIIGAATGLKMHARELSGCSLYANGLKNPACIDANDTACCQKGYRAAVDRFQVWMSEQIRRVKAKPTSPPTPPDKSGEELCFELGEKAIQWEESHCSSTPPKTCAPTFNTREEGMRSARDICKANGIKEADFDTFMDVGLRIMNFCHHVGYFKHPHRCPSPPSKSVSGRDKPAKPDPRSETSEGEAGVAR